ncbi:MAG: polyketide cyclase [Chloroflexi bacterium]|nr:polyketide cyclase [Chloroflexota bacterium]
MRIEQFVDIAAPPERVWAVMADVERWHEWTASITSIERLDGGAFGLGSRARVRQPRLRPALFTVTAFESVGGSRATRTLELAGWPLALIASWVRGLSTRYVAMEAAELKQRAE